MVQRETSQKKPGRLDALTGVVLAYTGRLSPLYFLAVIVTAAAMNEPAAVVTTISRFADVLAAVEKASGDHLSVGHPGEERNCQKAIQENDGEQEFATHGGSPLIRGQRIE